MRAHHRAVVDRLLEQFGQDPAFPALLIGGSIARGWESDDSDVDIVLVATDEEYQRRKPDNAFHYFTRDLSDYPGGYVDGKIIDWQFLLDVADHGSEPARSAFAGNIVVFSRIRELESLLVGVTRYPEEERSAKISSFYAQVQALQWYMGEADKRSNRYLAMHVAADLALFGSRMILAHNRILYPYHKWLLAELARAPEKPENLIALIDQLLEHPCKDTADPFCQAVLSFTDWEQPREGWPARFMQDSEWNWRQGRPPLADW